MPSEDMAVPRNSGLALRADLMSRERSDQRCLVNAVVFSLLLIAAAILALYPDSFNRPLARAVNSVTRDQHFASMLAFGLTYPALQGVIVVSLLWYCWFSTLTAELRGRVMSGILAAVVAAVFAFLLQRTLSTSPKPIFDPVLEFQLPASLGDLGAGSTTSFPNSHTFPSERATMFAGLAIAVFLIRPKIGLVALASTMVVEMSRIDLGLHYPTDIIGSVSLAAAMVWLAQMRWGLELGLRFVRWEKTSASTFYMCAYFACYEMTTTFQDLRDITAQLLR